MPSYYAEQQIIGDDGKHVSNRLLPICDTITKLGEKIARSREAFPLKEGQQFADRIYVYRVRRNPGFGVRPMPHGIYVFEDGKLKRKKHMYFVEGVIEAEDRWDD
jgi:hypothetical protein